VKTSRRFSICYAAPGQRLLGTAGSTRNVLSVASAMSQWADVTVAFRSIAGAPPRRSFKIIAIDPDGSPAPDVRDDVAVRGLNPFAHAAYLRTLRKFSERAMGTYDVMFEKGWRFSGYLACAARRAGMPSAVIENDVRYRDEPIRNLGSLVRHWAQKGTQWVAARSSRQVPMIIAETEELKEALVALRGIAPECIEVVELGVDHQMFKPMDQTRARADLRISRGATVLLYVGGLDMYHDLGPVIEALGEQTARHSIELHVVGDGELRAQYEANARRKGVRATFYGQVPHTDVPRFIAASDLCLAPYQPSHFYAGKIAFSTLKIPEYMACERPVASVPQGHIAQLIENRVNGFLLPNERSAWNVLLRSMPSRVRLMEMGRSAANRVSGLSWENTARRYLELAQGLASR
jgi:glycosyltransferase involved in cell wall biosynthesis